jgi:hypothetical protein
MADSMAKSRRKFHADPKSLRHLVDRRSGQRRAELWGRGIELER